MFCNHQSQWNIGCFIFIAGSHNSFNTLRENFRQRKKKLILFADKFNNGSQNASFNIFAENHDGNKDTYHFNPNMLASSLNHEQFKPVSTSSLIGFWKKHGKFLNKYRILHKYCRKSPFALSITLTSLKLLSTCLFLSYTTIYHLSSRKKISDTYGWWYIFPPHVLIMLVFFVLIIIRSKEKNNLQCNLGTASLFVTTGCGERYILVIFSFEIWLKNSWNYKTRAQGLTRGAMGMFLFFFGNIKKHF